VHQLVNINIYIKMHGATIKIISALFCLECVIVFRMRSTAILSAHQNPL